jgi:hypothetical protein
MIGSCLKCQEVVRGDEDDEVPGGTQLSGVGCKIQALSSENSNNVIYSLKDEFRY